MSEFLYWLISVPKKDGNKQPAQLVYENCTTTGLATANQFVVPDLKVGTLDSLMALSDELVKLDHAVEATTRKIAYQLYQLIEKSTGQVLSVGAATPDICLTRFQWDETKFSTRLPCRALTENIQCQISKIEEELRTQLQRFNTIFQAFSSAERKKTGNLNARDLSDIVRPEHFFESEYLTTVFVVVPKYSDKEFLATYAELATFVLPESARNIYEDNEAILYTVNLFKRSVDEFRNNCREKKFTAREHRIDREHFVSGQQSFQRLAEELNRVKTELVLWCKANFAEAFTIWLHMKAIRVHVESILRFGLPANYQAIMLLPKKKADKKLREMLRGLFNTAGPSVYDDGIKDDEAGGEKFFPYVYLEVNLDMKS